MATSYQTLEALAKAKTNKVPRMPGPRAIPRAIETAVAQPAAAVQRPPVRGILGNVGHMLGSFGGALAGQPPGARYSDEENIKVGSQY